jgi:general secretion pathway protein C
MAIARHNTRRFAAIVRAHGPAVLAAVLAVAIAADLAGVVARSLPRPHLAAPVRESRVPIADVRALGALFGQPDRAEVRSEAAPVDASGLELTGVISMTDPALGIGIIRRHGDTERSYRAGATLPGGATLVEIYPEYVVLDAGGSRTELSLPQARTGVGRPEQLARAAPTHRHDPVVAASPAMPTTAEERRQHPIYVPSSPVTSALHPRPLVVDEHIVGYSVTSDEDESPIRGLPRMALIREINGVRLTDGAIAGRMLNSLTAGGAATFVIQTRDGERTLTLDVSNVAALANPGGGQ